MQLKRYNDLPSTIIIGGLYGNLQSMKEIKKYEKNNQLIFNGDFHWLNKKKEEFIAVQKFVNRHITLKGNIEDSLSNPKNFDNCNCDYPDYFPPEETIFSNEIFSQLKETFISCNDYKNDFNKLDTQLYISIKNGPNIFITHGDLQSLNGWLFSIKSIKKLKKMEFLNFFDRVNADVIISSHTCLPVFCSATHKNGEEKLLLNNGAAGMPNFKNKNFGIVIRISSGKSPDNKVIYRKKVKNYFFEAIKLEYHNKNFINEFLSNWPSKSAGYKAYFDRIINGPIYDLADSIISK